MKYLILFVLIGCTVETYSKNKDQSNVIHECVNADYRGKYCKAKTKYGEYCFYEVGQGRARDSHQVPCHVIFGPRKLF